MKVEPRALSAITPYERNPRDNDAAVDAVAESIKRYGFRQPIVVDAEGVIVCGHTRWLAAQKLGMERVPVHVATDLTPEQIRAYRIADNKTGELATWDTELLSIELADLQDAGLSGGDWSLLGFDDDTLARLLDGARIHLVNTDPPYNVKVEPRSNNAVAAGVSSYYTPAPKEKLERTHHQSFDLARHPEKAKPTTKRLRAKDRPLANDFVPDEEFEELLLAWFGNMARALEPGRGFYIWGGYANVSNYPPALKASGLYFSQSIIWHKMHPVLGRKDFMGDHEWCFYGWKEGAAHVFLGPNNVPDVWSIKKVNPQSMVHLTEKPVELAVRAIQYSSRPGEHVLDLFGGSGSTLVACEQTNRRAFLMEIDPAYCDVIVERWERFTGMKAERVDAASASVSSIPRSQPRV